MRKNNKISWKEMNIKQRIIFVIDWVLRCILIVLIFLFIVAIGLNCSDRNNSSDTSVAFADTSDLSNLAGFNYTYDVKTRNFFSFGENGIIPKSGYYVCIVFDNITFSDFTISFTNYINYDSSDLPGFYLCTFVDNRLLDRSILKSYQYQKEVYFSCPFNENYTYAFCIYSYAASAPIDIDFELVFYPGTYVPGLANLFSSSSLDTYEKYCDSYELCFNDGYNEGQSSSDSSYDSGYEDGYNDGISFGTSSSYGIFSGSKISVQATYYSNLTNSTYSKSFSNLTPNLGYNSVLFNKTYNYLISSANNLQNDDLQTAIVTIYLSKSFSYNSERPFYISGSSRSDIYDITLVDINGNRYTAEFDSERNYFAEFSSTSGINSSAAISSIILNFGRASDTMSDASLSQDSGGYYQGYDLGYSDGEDQGYISGREDGITIGIQQGYQDGFDAAGGGGFSWLISSVQSFLNTNFFGDFGVGTLLYIGLGVALATLFIKMFAGG